jgi:DNA-binding response OmpR family regulator
MKKKILLIEDTEDLGEMICDILTISGFEVIWARNGCDGVTQYTVTKPDLVITDLVMPNLSGLEVISKIHEIDTEMPAPVIILSAKASPEDKEAGIKAGASLYLSKPCSSTVLLDSINGLLKRQSNHE